MDEETTQRLWIVASMPPNEERGHVLSARPLQGGEARA